MGKHVSAAVALFALGVQAVAANTVREDQPRPRGSGGRGRFAPHPRPAPHYTDGVARTLLFSKSWPSARIWKGSFWKRKMIVEGSRTPAHVTEHLTRRCPSLSPSAVSSRC